MTTQSSPIIPENILLKHIEVMQQKVDATSFKKHKTYQLAIGHKIMHNLEDGRLKMELIFGFKDEKEIEMISFQIDFHFEVKELSNFYILNDKDHPIFSEAIIATLLGISVSTARGIIFEKLQNAGLSNVIIPVVSPVKMLKQSHP